MGARREHPLRATLAIAEQALRAGDLATRGLWRVDAASSCEEAAKRMEERDFDVAPLAEEPLRRFVLRRDLERAERQTEVQAVAHPIGATRMVTVDLGRNLEAGLIDVLTLDDRFRLVCKVPRFRRDLGFVSRRRFESWAEELKRLRDSVAHGRTILDHEPMPIARWD